MVQSVPKDAVEQSYYGKIMIGPYWGSVDRLEVAGFDFCLLRTYFNTVISQLCFELQQIRDHFYYINGGHLGSVERLHYLIANKPSIFL